MKYFFLLIICASCTRSPVATNSGTGSGSLPIALYSFRFIGYDIMEPSDWILIDGALPTCNYSQGTVCYINARKNINNDYPAVESLVQLSQASNHFTSPYTGSHGKVTLKP